MEKEQVIEKLEKVFTKACDVFDKQGTGSLTEIRELGEAIIRAKQNVAHEVKQAEKFIERKIEMSGSLSQKDITRIARELKNMGVASVR